MSIFLRSLRYGGISSCIVTGIYCSQEYTSLSNRTKTATRLLPSHLAPWRKRYPDGIIHLYPREDTATTSEELPPLKGRCFQIQENIAGILTRTHECPFGGPSAFDELLYECIVTVHPSQEERKVFDFVAKNMKLSVQQSIEDRALSLFQIFVGQGITHNDLERMFEATPDALFPHIPKRCNDQNRNREALERIVCAWKELAVLPKECQSSLPEKLKTDVFGGLTSAQDRLYFAESFATMLGYRAIGPSWVDFSRDPSPADSTMAQIAAREMVAAVGTQFPHRSTDDIGDNPYPFPLVFFLQTQQQVSVGKTPEARGLPSRRFAPRSYPAFALLEGMSMRAHVSGSAPLTLAALALSNPSWTKEELKNITGFLACVYLHGDFHTPLETAAGVVHFAKMQGIPLIDKQAFLLEDLDPKEFRTFAMDCARDLVDVEHIHEFEQLRNNADREAIRRAIDLQAIRLWV